jgi:hypothetical protein
MPIDEVEIRQIAEAWAGIYTFPEGSEEHQERFWAYGRLWELIQDDPEDAWKVIQAIRQLDVKDWVLTNLAAGPLEDLLVYHGERFIDRVEVLSRRDPQFRKLLGGVWQNAMSDALWARVQAVAGPSW